MKRIFLNLLFSLQFILIFGQSAIEKRLAEFEQTPSLQHAVIGFELFDLQSNTVLAALNNKKALSPASTLKLITTASAMEILGPDFRFETQLCITGEIDKDGTLQGDIYIIGGGDPTLGSSFFPNKNEFTDNWFRALSSRNIRGIKGNVYIDASCYGEDPVSPKWLVEDIGNYYAAGIYGAAIFDNAYRLTLGTGEAGEKATIKNCEPSMDGYLDFENEILAGGKNSATIEGLPFCYVRMLKGSLLPNKDSITLKGDIPNVPLFMQHYILRELTGKGMKITESEMASGTIRNIATTYSPALNEIITITNFKSNNLFADYILKQIGYQASNKTKQGTFQSGIQAIRNFWKTKNIDLTPFTLYDGSGLAPADKISANAINSILAYMYNESNHGEIFLQSIPKAGEEGTVADFLPRRTKANIRLKSGSMGGVRAYSGYILKNKKSYCITILCNNFSASGKSISKEIASLFLDLYELL